MKEINLSCTSQNSTAIICSTMDLQSPSSSSIVGGRAIDRYNPIITDERRRGPISQSAPTTPLPTNNKTPLQIKPLSPLIILRGKKNSNKKKLIPRNKKNSKNITNKYAKTSSCSSPCDHQQVQGRKSLCKQSDVEGCTTSRPGVEYMITPPESARYLLDDSSFVNVLSDFDPVLKLEPYEGKNKAEPAAKLDFGSKAMHSSSSSSSGCSDQVVVLRVSLHCRGCERKMKKHLSRMAGVKSFNIDFTAKKVTVIGNVTPLEVLASISKVKNAQIWTPPMSSSLSINSRNMESKW